MLISCFYTSTVQILTFVTVLMFSSFAIACEEMLPTLDQLRHTKVVQVRAIEKPIIIRQSKPGVDEDVYLYEDVDDPTIAYLVVFSVHEGDCGRGISIFDWYVGLSPLESQNYFLAGSIYGKADLEEMMASLRRGENTFLSLNAFRVYHEDMAKARRLKLESLKKIYSKMRKNNYTLKLFVADTGEGNFFIPIEEGRISKFSNYLNGEYMYGDVSVEEFRTLVGME